MCTSAAALIALSAGGMSAFAQQPVPAPAAPASFDPSDVYFQAWLLSNDADKLAKAGKPSEALDKYRRAAQLFDTVSKTFPDWKTDMVAGRKRKTADAIASVFPEAKKEQEKEQAAMAELEGGQRVGVVPSADPGGVLDSGIPAAPIPPTQSAETLDSRRIRELEKQVARLTGELNRGATTQQAQRQRDMALAELQRARTELDRMRRDSAEGSVRGEVDALARRINKLESEKEAMARALEASHGETTKAQAQVDALQTERARLNREVDRLRQQVADTQRDLELERQSSNDVVAGQLRQIQQLQATISEKDKQLGDAQRIIEGLETELDEIRESFEELRDERDELLAERDRMKALLDLNEAGQLQQVIDQNLALDRELRETKKRYEALQEDSDASKDDLLQALRDLAISKMRIQQFRQQDAEQQKRLAELEQRLQAEASTVDRTAVNPGEAAMLRGIIERQLKVQEKRAEARQILLDSLGEKAQEDDDIRRAMAIYQGAELNLTPEEMRIIDAQEVDGVIISPYARPRSEVEQSMADLASQLKPFENAGARAYRNGRLLAARETFEMIVERNPGDDASMCKLGLVEYKLDPTNPVSAAEMFRRAAELNPRNPFAQRMLGFTLDKLGERQEAIAALERAVELAPTLTENHLLLGSAHFRNGELDDAEDAYKTALSCEPTSNEAHYNLAVLYTRLGKRDQAIEHYNRAIENGAPPNPDLERRIEGM